MGKVDICVLTAGRFDLLQQCLDNIRNEMEFTPCNLYIFDNGSPADEFTLFKKLFEQPFVTKWKRTNQNGGFPKGANSAIKMGDNSLVMFISDDVMIQPGSIRSLVETMNSNPNISLCGMKLLFSQFSDDKTRPAGKVQHVGHSVDLRGNIIHPFMGWSPDNPKTCNSQEVISVTGAAFMVRRRMFQKAGGFNEIYGKGYMEDVELCLQLRQLGSIIYIDTNAVAEHYVGATFTSRKEGSPLQDNKSIFMSRNRQSLTWTDWLLR
jgi:GT2 family glycosyltransferase